VCRMEQQDPKVHRHCFVRHLISFLRTERLVRRRLFEVVDNFELDFKTCLVSSCFFLEGHRGLILLCDFAFDLED